MHPTISYEPARAGAADMRPQGRREAPGRAARRSRATRPVAAVGATITPTI